MAALGEVVVLVTSQHVDLEWMCDASASCNVRPCAQMARRARYVQAWAHSRRYCKGGIGVGRLWTVLCGWFGFPGLTSNSSACVHDIQREKQLIRCAYVVVRSPLPQPW